MNGDSIDLIQSSLSLLTKYEECENEDEKIRLLANIKYGSKNRLDFFSSLRIQINGVILRRNFVIYFHIEILDELSASRYIYFLTQFHKIKAVWSNFLMYNI